MKRCPQCEFIYEDDQSLCDMDGVLLVFDSRTLPNHHALTTVPAPAKEQRRTRMVPAFATLVLALVLGMVYYVSTRRPGHAPAPAPATLSVEQVTIPPTPEPEPSEEPTPAQEEVKPEAPKERTTAPVKKAAVKTTSAPQPKPSPDKKDDSKVNSILKKTGRILKKPFKF